MMYFDWDYYYYYSDDQGVIYCDWKDKRHPGKRSVKRKVYDRLGAGARYGAWNVFKRECFRGISVEDVVQQVSIEYLTNPEEARDPWALGRTMGYRRALSIVTRTPKAIEFSVIQSEMPVEELFASRGDPPEFQLMRDELIDALAGSGPSIDRTILDSRIVGMTFEEIASKLGMPPSTVRTRYGKMVARHQKYRDENLI